MTINKGDIVSGSGSNNQFGILPAGTDGQIPVYDSTTPTGLNVTNKATLQSQTFTSNGTWTAPTGVTVINLSGRGGSGGGAGGGGGGGAGGGVQGGDTDINAQVTTHGGNGGASGANGGNAPSATAVPTGGAGGFGGGGGGGGGLLAVTGSAGGNGSAGTDGVTGQLIIEWVI
jgi:hypothetical protein